MSNDTTTTGIRVIDDEGHPHEYAGADGFEDVRGTLHVTKGSQSVAAFRRWDYAERIA